MKTQQSTTFYQIIVLLVMFILTSITYAAQDDYPPAPYVKKKPPRFTDDQGNRPPRPFEQSSMDNDNPPPPPPPGHQRPPRPDGKNGKQPRYSIEQAISDRAQLNTIAFSGLAFFTGNFECNTFLPPGKVCDYFGFQYMRDVQPQGMGHNTDFLTRIANNMIYILTDTQKNKLLILAKKQERMGTALALKRFPLIHAFCRELEGDIPSGSKGLNKNSVKAYTASIFEMDGRLAYDRAVVYGDILSSLSDSQKAYISKMSFSDYTTWPDMDEILDKQSMSHDVHVLMMTYASDLFSWYKGSVKSDTYFCPERHGTYFGGFYMKDAPAMGHRNYTISTRLTGDSGEKFLSILTTPQRERITSIIDLQRNAIKEIVTTRKAISAELRRGLTKDKASINRIQTLSRKYGELDGELSWLYAIRFAEVRKSLSSEQKSKLILLRNLEEKPDGVFIYSEPIRQYDIPNTDFLFREPSKSP